MPSVAYTNVGEQKVVDIIDETATSPTSLGTGKNFVDWGTGTVAAAKTDTALGTPAPEARSGGTVSQVTTNETGDTNQWVATITATAARAITEAGLFDAVTGGVLIIRGEFAVINLVTNDKIEFTITLAQT